MTHVALRDRLPAVPVLAPPGRRTAGMPSGPASRGGGPGPGLPVLVLGCLLVAAVSLLLPWQVTYDPLAWLVWGREVAGLHLSTTLGPAWKPLPVLLDTVFSVLGGAAPAAWLVVARAGGLLALALAYRLAASVAGALAGAVAVLVLLTSNGWVGELLLPGMSEPLLTALALLAVDAHRRGRAGAALTALVGAALLRPEVWPFLGLYGAWLWFREPRLRRALVVGAVTVPALWFGPEWWGSGNPVRSAERAAIPSQGGPLLTAHPVQTVLRSMALAVLPGAWAGVAAAVALAVGGLLVRGRTTALRGVWPVVLALLVLAAGWVGVVAAMTRAGVSAGDERYLVVAVALLAVVAGIGWGRTVTSAWRLLRSRRRSLLTIVPARVAGLALLVLAGWVAGQNSDDLAVRRHAVEEQLREHAAQDEDPAVLTAAVRQVGGPTALARCGGVFTGPYEFPLVAWVLDRPLSSLGYDVRVPGTVLRSRTEGLGRPATVAPYRAAPLGGQAARQWEVLTTCPSVRGPSRS